jgi:hypothetical protein
VSHLGEQCSGKVAPAEQRQIGQGEDAAIGERDRSA